MNKSKLARADCCAFNFGLSDLCGGFYCCQALLAQSRFLTIGADAFSAKRLARHQRERRANDLTAYFAPPSIVSIHRSFDKM